MNLYTVIVFFADYKTAAEQYEAETPFDALKIFIDTAESLRPFDRTKILAALNSTSLIQTKPFKGLWVINFSLEITKMVGATADVIYGGFVVQSDPKGPIRT